MEQDLYQFLNANGRKMVSTLGSLLGNGHPIVREFDRHLDDIQSAIKNPASTYYNYTSKVLGFLVLIEVPGTIHNNTVEYYLSAAVRRYVKYDPSEYLSHVGRLKVSVRPFSFNSSLFEGTPSAEEVVREMVDLGKKVKSGLENFNGYIEGSTSEEF